MECSDGDSGAECGDPVESDLSDSVEVYVSLCCGTQSDREEAESFGYVYIGLDIVSDIYSSVLNQWVRCVECDVDKLDVVSMGCVVRRFLDDQGYQGRNYSIVQ